MTLIRVTGDWNLAEECAQDAFALALEHWRRDGIPRRPGAWLTTPSRHRAMDLPEPTMAQRLVRAKRKAPRWSRPGERCEFRTYLCE